MEIDLNLLTLTEEPIVPGLLSLNMNISYVLDIHQIEDQIKAFSIRKDIEHPCVHDVLDNMIAILKLKLPTEKFAAQDCLQSILKRNPNNLNALADLEHVYRKLHRIEDADKQRTAIENLLHGSGECYKKYKACCLLEQGYALIHDMDADIEGLANNKLTDAHKMLQAEFQKSDTERKIILQKCLDYNKQTISNLDESISCKRIDPHFFRKVNGLQKFQQGKAMYDQHAYETVWNYYIAEAWNRYVDSLQKIPKRNGVDKQELIKEATCKSLELYFQIVNVPDKKEKKATYVARALAQIGYILIKRSHVLINQETNFAFLNDKRFREFLDDPLIPLHDAYRMQEHSQDTFTLNRYGRALYNLEFGKKIKERQNILKHADYVLTTSVKITTFNWFAYSTRMKVLGALCDTYIYKDKSRARRYLFRAFEDGHQCFLSKGSATDMECLAYICQKIAKFPNIYRPGKDHVKDRNQRYLHYALNYLQHGWSLSGPHDYTLANRMALCLYDLGDVTSAAEWMKRSISLTECPEISHYKNACLYQLKRFWSEREQHQQHLYLIKEIVYALHECQKKLGGIKQVCKYMVRDDFCAVSDLITDTIDVPKLLTQEGIDIIKYVIRIASTLNKSQPRRLEQLTSYHEKMQHVLPLSEVEINLEEKFNCPTAPIPVPTNTSPVPKGYEYHFFVSHSQKDVEWVKNVLLFELESKYSDDDIAFKGCFHERDFHPGNSIIQNITDAINKSYKIIVVLTKHFIKSRWCNDEMEKALIRHVGVRKCVIPLVLETLEENEIPDCLSNVTYLDVTLQDDELTFRQKIEKLKEALRRD